MRTWKLNTKNKTVILKFPYDEDLVKQVKLCDRGAFFNKHLKQWVLSVNEWTKDKIINLVSNHNFVKELTKEEREVVYCYRQKPVDYAYLKGLTDAQDFTYTPRNYQLESLGYALEKGSFINGDDCGLGKTFESIMYAEVTNSFPCLVIEPASVKYNWAEKWAEITKGRRSISVIDTAKDKNKRKENQNNWDADVIIINYDITAKKQGKGATVKYDQLKNIPWEMVIFDEAHFLKEKTSQRAKAAKMIVKNVDRVQLLTGTATMNKPEELWNLLCLIGKEKEISENWEAFVLRYCDGYKGFFGWVTDGASNLMELNKKLRDSCYLRREKSEVLKELPPTTKQILNFSLSNKKAYEKAKKDLISYLLETQGEEKADKAAEAETLVSIGVLRKLSIEGKIKAIEQYLKDWKTAGKPKLLVFGLHREQLGYLSEKFKCPLIAGGIDSKKKQKIVNDFKKSDDVFLFANMQSAGTGVDGLQEVCSNMLIIELPWRPSDLAQVIARLDRSGQKDPVTVTFALCRDSIDMEMWDMLTEKEVMTSAINQGQNIDKRKTGLKYLLKKILNDAAPGRKAKT